MRQIVLVMLVLLVSGCAGMANWSLRQNQTSRDPSWSDTWKKLTIGKSKGLPRWDWASCVPADGVRATTIVPTIPHAVLAHFVPDLHSGQVQLASVGNPDQNFRIVNIDGNDVRTFADIYDVSSRTATASESIQIDIIDASAAPESPKTALVLQRSTLAALTQATAVQQPVIKVADGGNPGLMIREGGVQCGLTIRIERQHGLLQVVASLSNQWGVDRLLPVEVTAQCNGEMLRCLTAAETLELLYGDGRSLLENQDQTRTSFFVVSQLDDYLIPTNYHRLHENITKAARKRTEHFPSALASIGKEIYPGPAVLGDARALTGIMLQPTICRAGMPEQTGWILFAGKSLRTGGNVTLAIDLGNGLQELHFTVPQS
jgi:hypothetical protein